MGMSIHGGSYTAAQTMQWQQRRQNFDALSQAITSGNLSGANDALTKIKSLLPPGADIKADSFLGKLSAALQSGDMTAAQQLLASRQNQNRAQTTGPDAAQAPDAPVAASAGNGPAAATSGRHHHHHGGGASPVLDLNKAIQTGDTAKAQSSMQTIIGELQQLATAGAQTGSGANALAASASSAAQKLLENPDFKALADAVAKGDASGMKDAWMKLIAGAGAAPAPTTQAAA
jgi:hypothetical protein